VVYDSIGHRGAFAAEALQMLGYANARSLSGGSDAWAAAGFALEK
jgi:rhodanese-related sulfurtransferase